MKQTKRCVALAVSALMLSTLVPVSFNTAYAEGLSNDYFQIYGLTEEENLEDLNYIPMGIMGQSVEVDNTEYGQAESDLNDPNFSSNATYKVVASSAEALQLNTTSVDTKVVEKKGSNIITIGGLASGMKYYFTVYKNGSVIGTSQATTELEFLIIVGESLYSGIKSSLDTY